MLGTDRQEHSLWERRLGVPKNWAQRTSILECIYKERGEQREGGRQQQTLKKLTKAEIKRKQSRSLHALWLQHSLRHR